MESANPLVLDLEQLQLGMKYELVLTNNGLYRYRVGDVVRIDSFYKKMPLFELCYRRGSVINMVGEKCSEEHIMSVLRIMENIDTTNSEEESKSEWNATKGPGLTDFTSSVDMSGAAPRYIIYVELAVSDESEIRNLSWSSTQFDRLLQIENDQYGVFRAQG